MVIEVLDLPCHNCGNIRYFHNDQQHLNCMDVVQSCDGNAHHQYLINTHYAKCGTFWTSTLNDRSFRTDHVIIFSNLIPRFTVNFLSTLEIFEFRLVYIKIRTSQMPIFAHWAGFYVQDSLCE